MRFCPGERLPVTPRSDWKAAFDESSVGGGWRTHFAWSDSRTAAPDYPWRLSGGMAQRVQIARALALEPKVLLMDEPFGALDAITKASLQDVLLDVQQETDATVVFITHDLDEAIYLSDRVLVISGRPGAIALAVPTELPRPRDQLATRELPRYLRVRHHAWTSPASRGWLAGPA